MSAITNEFLLGSIGGEENDHIVEVVLVKENSKSRYEIRLLSFGEGIGWYIQKTLPLDSDQARILGKMLSRTNVSPEGKLIKEEQIPASRKIIGLPL